MQAAKLGNADLSRVAKVSKGAVTQWLNGQTHNLRAESAVAIELATNHRALWIVRGVGEKLTTSPQSKPLTYEAERLDILLQNIPPERRTEAYVAATQALIDFLPKDAHQASALHTQPESQERLHG